MPFKPSYWGEKEVREWGRRIWAERAETAHEKREKEQWRKPQQSESGKAPQLMENQALGHEGESGEGIPLLLFHRREEVDTMGTGLDNSFLKTMGTNPFPLQGFNLFLSLLGKEETFGTLKVTNVAWEVPRINVEMFEPEFQPTLLPTYQRSPSPPQSAGAESSVSLSHTRTMCKWILLCRRE